MPDSTSGAPRSGIRVTVIGTCHELQRHQDKMPDREQVRAQFEKRLHQIITEDKIDLVAEEAGDDEETWKRLKYDDEITAEFERALHRMMMRDNAEAHNEKKASVFDHDTGIDSAAPTIARTIAENYGARHSDVDVAVRAEEGNAKSIAKRDIAIADKILTVVGAARSVLVIVGEAHRAGVAERLKNAHWAVKSFHFPGA